MNEQELVEKIKEHLGLSVLVVNTGDVEYAVSVHKLCTMALEGRGAPQKIQLPPSSGQVLGPLARQISENPRARTQGDLEDLLSSPHTREVLKGMAHEIATQDVRATSHPMYCVREARVTHVQSADPYCDKAVWVDEDGNEANGKLAKELEEAFHADNGTEIEATFDDETSDYLRIQGETPYADSEYTKTYTRYAMHKRFEVVTTFFTNKSAETYIEENRHKLHDPHVYVDSGYRNYEWQFMRALIVALGRSL